MTKEPVQYLHMTNSFTEAVKMAVIQSELNWVDISAKLSSSQDRGDQMSNGWSKINKPATTINGIRHQLGNIKIFAEMVNWDLEDCLQLYQWHIVSALKNKKLARAEKIDSTIAFVEQLKV